MPKKIEVRESDTLTIKVRVSRASDDGEKVTITVMGQPFTGGVEWLDLVKHERGPKWPG